MVLYVAYSDSYGHIVYVFLGRVYGLVFVYDGITLYNARESHVYPPLVLLRCNHCRFCTSLFLDFNHHPCHGTKPDLEVQSRICVDQFGQSRARTSSKDNMGFHTVRKRTLE